MDVINPHCEYLENPIGIDILRPSLYWQMLSSRRGAKQTAYQIQVSDDPKAFETGGALLWDTNKTQSDQSAHIVYGGHALVSAKRYFWRVRVWDELDFPSQWSEIQLWETGLLNPNDWKAKWIEPEGEIDPKAYKPCPFLRTTFNLENHSVKQARAYVTAHGVYEFSINGKVVGDHVMAPGYTSYHRRLQYQTYEIEKYLSPSENAIGVILGDGWYRGKNAGGAYRNVYGEKLALLLQICIIFKDGSEQWVISDENWKTTTGPILKSDLQEGETYDARLEIPGWDCPDFNDKSWRNVSVADFGYDNIVSENGVHITRHETFTPKVLHTPDGGVVLDFSQNIAGRVRMRVQGKAGTCITLQHGETLDENGNFTMKNFSPPRLIAYLAKMEPLRQETTYTLRGQGIETFEPKFSFQGFRYARLDGYPGEPMPENFSAIAIYSNMRPTGTFECSHELLNRLHKNIEWSMKGNFVGIPTDCPHREKAGWTGDAQVFSRTGSYIMETVGFYRNWLKDLSADQKPDGKVPNMVPDPIQYVKATLTSRTDGSTGWADASVIIPWTVYLCFGDKRILEEQYGSMKAWVDYMDQQAANCHWTKKINPVHRLRKPGHTRYILDTGYHWGEWLEPGVNVLFNMICNFLFSQPNVATAYYASSSEILAKAARILGKSKDADHYERLSEKVKSAWDLEFVRRGKISPDIQAAYVRALAFTLIPEAKKPLLIERLVRLIQAKKYHIGTGFLSTSLICQVLADNGHLSDSYKLLLQVKKPSWLYPVTKGATTIWEFWDAIGETGKVNMSSHNHYSPGSVGSFLYQFVGGIDIDPENPGYKHFYIRPRPGGEIKHAKVDYQSLYGEMLSDWEIKDGKMRLRVNVPANTCASVWLPDALLKDVKESQMDLDKAEGIGNIIQREQSVSLLLQSGRYFFEYPWR